MSNHPKPPPASQIAPSFSQKLSKCPSLKEDHPTHINNVLNLNLEDELFLAEQLHTSEKPVLERPDVNEPTGEAITFLNSLDSDHLDTLVFQEQLVTTSENDDLGEFVISIEPAVFQHQECYLIIAKSQGYVEGVLCGTSFTAYVDSQLQTIEQRHHEFVKVSPIPLDRKSLFIRKNDTYIYIKTLTTGKETTRFQKAWRVMDVPALILEGANILLVRAMISSKHAPADFQVTSIDSDGDLCNCQYSDLATSVKEICHTFVPVIGLQRSIFSKENSISWRYFLTAEGYMLIRQQVGSPVIMKVIQIPSKRDKKEEYISEKFKKQPLDWDKDMELRSKFTDKKSKIANDFSVYLGQKPEVRSLLADFLQFLLLRKPDDVVSFASRYFSSFSSYLPPAEPFLNCTNTPASDTQIPPPQQ